MNNSTKQKPRLEITPRHIWLKQRIDECIEGIKRAQEIEDWEDYKKRLLKLTDELSYATTEWSKYYE
jgi:hypothetical protein